MPWFYVDDAFADSKPVMRLPEQVRNEALGLWVRCGAWSAKEETDGHVPMDVVRQFGGNKRLVTALANIAELWHPLDDEQNWRKTREIVFKNWEKWQKTRAENEQKRKADAARQDRYRRNKKGRGFVAAERPNSTYTELSHHNEHRDNALPAPPPSEYLSRRESQRPDPDPTLSSHLSVCSPVGNANPTGTHRPPEFCEDHPGGTPDRCGDCANARRHAQEWDRAVAAQSDLAALARADQRQRERQQLRDCPLCDSAGWVIDHDDLEAPARRCNHQTPTTTGANTP